MRDPQKAIEAQGRLATDFLSLWIGTLKRLQGDEAQPVAVPDPKDNRFRDPEWSENLFFDFIKQAYLLTSRWAESLVDEAEHIDENTRLKAHFYLRQLSSALSPSNFVPTNPELIRETLKENGANLVRGMQMLVEDIEAGQGRSRSARPIRPSSRSASTSPIRPARSCSATSSSSSCNTSRPLRRS